MFALMVSYARMFAKKTWMEEEEGSIVPAISAQSDPGKAGGEAIQGVSRERLLVRTETRICTHFLCARNAHSFIFLFALFTLFLVSNMIG